MRVGLHVGSQGPLEAADAVGADVIQIHLSSPRTWAPPKPRADADALCDSGRVVSVHAPYLCNLASADPVVRERSVVLLQATLDAAPTVGAEGVVVHAGQAGADGDVADAIARWVELLPTLSGDTPLWIENTASGKASVGRHLDDVARLFEALRGLDGTVPVGACLDTAHAFAGDPAATADPAGWVKGFAEAAGGVDLVHVNDSAAPAGSGRDRHANLAEGEIGLEAMAAMLAASGAPAAVLETPGEDADRARDLVILRHLLRCG